MDEDRPLDPGTSFELGEQAVDVVNVPGAFDLGDHDDVDLVADLGDDLGEIVEDPGGLERVDPRPQLSVAELHLAPDPEQAFARGDLPVDGDGILEVAEQDVDRRGDVRHLGDHLLVGEVEKVNHPRGPERDVAHRLRGADGQRVEEGSRVAHLPNATGAVRMRACPHPPPGAGAPGGGGGGGGRRPS